MTPDQLRDALAIRQRRADRAQEAYAGARRNYESSLAELERAIGELTAFDRALREGLAAFRARMTASAVAEPNALEGMKIFHADQIALRKQMAWEIEERRAKTHELKHAADEARTAWVRADQKARNLQDLREDALSALRRIGERRSESENDEMSGARALRGGS